MFQFTRCPPHILCVQIWVTRHYPRWVSPFGNLRIIAFVLLPVAYRCLHVLLRQLVPRHSSHTLCSLIYLLYILKRSSLGAFNAQSTNLYAVVKMLLPLRHANRPVGSSAKRNDTRAQHQSQGAPRYRRNIGTLGSARISASTFEPDSIRFNNPTLLRVGPCQKAFDFCFRVILSIDHR